MIEGQKRKFQQLAEKHPDLRQLYLARIKVWEDRNVDENAFLDALKQCDAILGEVEDELAKKWQGKQGSFSTYIKFQMDVECRPGGVRKFACPP